MCTGDSIIQETSADALWGAASESAQARDDIVNFNGLTVLLEAVALFPGNAGVAGAVSVSQALQGGGEGRNEKRGGHRRRRARRRNAFLEF